MLDRNLEVAKKLNKPGIRFYSVEEAPFRVYGVYLEDGKYRRIPEEVAKAVSPGVWRSHACTAGGRVRFRTDSPYIAVSVKLGKVYRYSHFSLLGSAGMDLYTNNVYFGSFVPPLDVEDHYESLKELGSREMRSITIHMPSYAEVKELQIGLDPEAVVEAPEPYANTRPVVFYGSSITQGGTSSRPGLSYENMISRRLNMDYVNLGFSGNAKGEDAIAEYIAGLSMQAFVYDYDHNSPDPEHLRCTHGRMFSMIRQRQPELPVVMMTRPQLRITKGVAQRLEVIKQTYSTAAEAGDTKVFLLTGQQLMEGAEEGLTDGTHPNDIGFAAMARVLGDLMEQQHIVEG